MHTTDHHAAPPISFIPPNNFRAPRDACSDNDGRAVEVVPTLVRLVDIAGNVKHFPRYTIAVDQPLPD